MDDGQQLMLQFTSPAPHSISSGAPSASVWPPTQPAGAAPSPPYPGTMFALHARQADIIHYAQASPTGTPYVQQHARDDVYSTSDPAGHALPLGRAQPPATLSLAQIESSVGPSRVLTRRQARAQAALQQTRAASSLHGAVHDGSPVGPTQTIFYPSSLSNPSMSRPQTPNAALMNSPPYPPLSRPEFISLSNGAMAMSTGQTSPPFPSTPMSASSAHSPFQFFRHSRSASNATSNPRSASPALSIVSAMTSVSSASAHNARVPHMSDMLPTAPMSPVVVPEEKKKKGRLTNKDRKDICEYHKNVPDARQEDIAQLWQVERSTISKIIKAKDKWLAVPSEDNWKVAKHKPSKFPEIERELDKWLRANASLARPQVLSDQIIRNKAKEIARDLHIPEEKFKASSGWVENFKHRHSIRRGVWTPSLMGENGWIPSAAAKAQSVEEDEEQGTSGSISRDNSHTIDQDLSSSVLQAAWEPVPPPLPTRTAPPPQPPAGSNSTLFPPTPVDCPGRQSQPQEHSTPCPSSAECQMDVATPIIEHQGFIHPDLSHAAYFNSSASGDAQVLHHPTPFQPDGVHAVAVAGHTSATDGLSLPASVPVPAYPPGVMVYPPPLPKDPPVSVATHDAPGPYTSVSSTRDAQPPARKAVPDIRAAQESMDILLDFFDAQPTGSIITTDDREKLSQIHCKLFARASGLAYQREDRMQQRRASA